MKKITFFVLLLSTFCLAAPNAADYPVILHVTSSSWGILPGTNGSPILKLNAVVDGKKLELAVGTSSIALHEGVTLLELGDYKAKLVMDEHKTSYHSSRAYELLFPDNKTEKFYVIGQSE